MLLLYIHL